MQEDILPSTRKIVETARFVKINPLALNKFCRSLTRRSLKNSKIKLHSNRWDQESLVGLITIFNAINFSYWAKKGEEKWQIKVGNQVLDGAMAVYRRLENKIREGTPFLNSRFLSTLEEEQVGKIFEGNVPLPMLKERTACLRELGGGLLANFNGRFENLVKKTNKSAVTFVNLLIRNFPSFNDSAIVEGIKVEFHKRAQLNAKMISDALENRGLGDFTDLDKLTIFADYKIPQVLRRLEILKYNQSLTDKVDNLVEIPAGSREEVEIRSSAILAAEEIKNKLKPRFPWITSPVLDSYFWLISQKKSPGNKPYHRTRTIYY